MVFLSKIPKIIVLLGNPDPEIGKIPGFLRSRSRVSTFFHYRATLKNKEEEEEDEDEEE
jgi:hypothetical protein